TESISVSPVTAMDLLLLRPLVENGLQQDLRDRRRRRAAEAVLVLERYGDCDLRIVRGGEGDEPGRVDAAVAGLGGAGLPGDLDPRGLSGGGRGPPGRGGHPRGDFLAGRRARDAAHRLWRDPPARGALGG